MSVATQSPTSPRRTRSGGVVAAFLRRDFAIIRSYRFPFVVDTIFGLLQLAVYYFLGRTFETSGTEQLSGAPNYFAFAAVGIAVSLVIESAGVAVADRAREEQLSGSLEALMAQPVRTPALALGLTSFPFVFAFIRALVYLAVALPWMHLDAGDVDPVGVVLILLASAGALTGVGILAGAAVMVFKRGQVVTDAAIFGMTLITGAVFPVEALPKWLEDVGSVMPLRFAFDGVRAALFQGGGWAGDFLGLMAYAVVGIPAAIWVLGRALEHTKRAGTLGQY